MRNVGVLTGWDPLVWRDGGETVCRNERHPFTTTRSGVIEKIMLSSLVRNQAWKEADVVLFVDAAQFHRYFGLPPRFAGVTSSGRYPDEDWSSSVDVGIVSDAKWCYGS
jgi:hypothetical protein